MIRAVLYDLDGVLVDACEWHYIALNMALKEISGEAISRAEHETVFNGLPTKRKLEILVQQGRVKEADVQAVWDKKQELTNKAIGENASPDAAKIALHEKTASMGIVSVCVTNSITETAKYMLQQTGQLRFMQFVITNEMVKNPKPHGEGYIVAMIKLGLMPGECLIVEDSDKGIRAANSTGASVLVVKGPDETASKVAAYLEGLK